MLKSKALKILMASCMAVSLVLTGCSTKNTKTDGKTNEAPTKLVWYLRDKAPANADSVLKKANEVIKSKINAELEIKFIPGGDYNQKMQLVMSSGEEFDICWTSNWANLYEPNVSKGAYLPLDDLLKNHPKLKALMPDSIWEACKVDGKLYGIPNLQVMYDEPGLFFKKDLVQKYNIDLNSVQKFADLENIFDIIKKNEPDVSPVGNHYASVTSLEFYPKVEGFFVDPKTYKIIDRSAEEMEIHKMARRWYEKGFFPSDIATLKDLNTLIKAGKIFCSYSRQKPGNEEDFKQSMGIEIVSKSFGKKVMNKGGVHSTLNSISVTSKNAAKAMELLELVNTDTELYNLLVFGIEGQDYKKVSSNRVQPISGGYGFAAWQIGNQFNAFLVGSQPDNVWEETKKGNQEAIVDPLFTFTLNRQPIENELAQINAVRNEFGIILTYGLDDPEKIVKLQNDKLTAAGVDKVKAEIQKQLDAWRASGK
jgi:putative aldouronate transport system substrate-binding protein